MATARGDGETAVRAHRELARLEPADASVWIALGETLLAAPWREVAEQALYQSLASGLIAPAAFAIAVARLGGAQAAAFGSLSPAAATLTGIVLLILPWTSVLGAIILTGYLGGAVASYMRIGEYYPPLVPFTTAVLAWLSVFLREPRLWVLLPIRRRS